MSTGKSHWFAFSFIGKAIDNGSTANASVYIGYPDKRITLKRMREANAAAGVRDGAALISVCHLGFMTKQEFIEGTE